MEWLQANWIPIALAVVALAVVNFSGPLLNGLKALASLLKAPATAAGDTASGDQDVLDMLALKRLTARYARLACPEGTAAMQTAASHFFHGTGTA